jgi:hypothetical protein
MSDTASSIPDWGTGSGVLISRVMDVRIMGLVRRALVDDVAERSAAIASLVCLLKVMIEMMVYGYGRSVVEYGSRWFCLDDDDESFDYWFCVLEGMKLVR